MTVMFAIRLDKSKNAKRKDGKSPIVLQVTWNRKVRRKRLGVYAHEHQFTIYKDPRGKKEKVELSDMHGVADAQSHIDSELRRAEQIYKENFQEREFTFSRFIDLFDKKEEEQAERIKVAEFCVKVAEDFETNGQSKSAHYYRYTGVAVLKVEPRDLHFEDFDELWLKKFVTESRKRGISCYNYLVHLKSIYNKAIEYKIVDFKNNPFKNPYTNPRGFDISKYKKSKIKKTNGERIFALNKTDLSTLKNCANLSPTQEKYMSIWWFSYYCFGVNLIDIANMKYRHIVDGRWYYKRSKTGKGLGVGKPLMPEALEIIEKYGTGNEDGYVFDILVGYDQDEKTISDRVLRYATYIRNACVRVSTKCKFKGYITFYSARHTAATVALNEGVEKLTASKLMDHRNLSTIDNYAGDATVENIDNAMKALRI